MTTSELKSNFHNLIDDIEDENILYKFYDIISQAKNTKDGVLWNRLTKKERDELILIEKEGSDSDSLISNTEMLQKHKKWL